MSARGGNELTIGPVEAPQIGIIGELSKIVSVLSWVDMYLVTYLGICLVGEDPFQKSIAFARLTFRA